MKKKLILTLLPFLALGISSCSYSTKRVTLSGALLSKDFKNDSSLDATNLFDLKFKNFTLSSGHIRICPAYLQNEKTADMSTISQTEATLKPLVSVNASQGFFDAGFAVDFSENQITCSFPQQYQFEGTEVTLVVYANTKMITMDGGSAVSLDLSRSDAVAITVNGAASISGEKAFALSSLQLNCNGAASFEAGGSVTNATYAIDGAASIKTKNLFSETVKVVIDGSGSAIVNASKSLDVTINGTGNVTYYGNATLTQSITGLGTINKGN